MVSIKKEIDMTQVFNIFAEKKCINHQRRKAYTVCLHEDCWNSEYDKAFFCADCNMENIKQHGNSLRFDALFNEELFDELDDYTKNQNTKDKSKERINKFDKKINELHKEIEQWTKCQFAELKNIFESHLTETDYFEVIKNLKKMLSEARIDLSLDYESTEKLKSYCIKMQKIQNDLNKVINEQIINESKKDYDKMDEELNLRLQGMGNKIQENMKNQVNQLAEYLIDSNNKSKSLRKESTIKKVLITEIKKTGNTGTLFAKMPIVNVVSTTKIKEAENTNVLVVKTPIIKKLAVIEIKDAGNENILVTKTPIVKKVLITEIKEAENISILVSKTPEVKNLLISENKSILIPEMPMVIEVLIPKIEDAENKSTFVAEIPIVKEPSTDNYDK